MKRNRTTVPVAPPYIPPHKNNVRGDRVLLTGTQQWCGNTAKHWPHYLEHQPENLCVGTADASTVIEDTTNPETGIKTFRGILR